jgi:hypothetical protein
VNGAELTRAGLVEVKPGVFEKVSHETNDVLRPAQGGAGQTGLSDLGAGEAAQLERDPGDGTVGEVPVQKGLGRRFLVRVKSYRCRLLDEDNMCEKYHVDLCRYAGALPSDAPGTAKIEVTQEKVGPKEQERVEIEIFEIA